ncbi:PD40 domain-containing protein [Streptomyces sannanensis]|uniref:PD40 domain-containing protein n=1 Tax=Streptomyces sannanensis TaxID=285536 RepID=A0ABP6SJM8_9ACTN
MFTGTFTSGRTVPGMRGRAAATAALALAAVLPALSAAPAHAEVAPGYERVNVSSTGEAQGGMSTDQETALSADGRFVAFTSKAANLVPGDTNGVMDVFVRDRTSGTTERVSVSGSGAQGTAASHQGHLVISPDGRYVAFSSDADNLVPGDANGKADLFLRDRQTGSTTRIASGYNAGWSYAVSFSPDGRYLAHEVPKSGVVLRDLVTGTTENLGSFSVYGLSLSADARSVAFASADSTLVPNDTNEDADIFVLDRQTSAITRVSVNSAGQQALSYTGSTAPSISADGRFVAFESGADNLVRYDTNQSDDIFVRDRQNNTTERVNLTLDGEEPTQDWLYDMGALAPQISADGRYVLFNSDHANMIPGTDPYAVPARIFLRDRQTGTTSVVDGPVTATKSSFRPSMASDGRTIAFSSDNDTLVPGDTNNAADVFVRTY